MSARPSIDEKPNAGLDQRSGLGVAKSARIPKKIYVDLIKRGRGGTRPWSRIER